MPTQGSLEDFSFIEIIQFIANGNKTGLLTLYFSPNAQTILQNAYHIWVYQGYIVAIANRLDREGLVSLIEHHHWVNPHILARLKEFCPNDISLGWYLKTQGVLKNEHLKHLFYHQVIQQLWVLCQAKDGQFKFEPNALIPTKEMTGLSVPAIELKGLINILRYVQTSLDNLLLV